MPFSHHSRLVNPRLGAYFGIFASAYIGLALMCLILEQLGVSQSLLRYAMLLLPVFGFAAIGIASYTREPLEYFASGRRVPAALNGLALAVTAMGATGIASVTGAIFLVGFDALCIVIGGLAGFVVMAVMLAPFLRKFGAFTLASYLGRRFESKSLRLLSASVLAVPMLLMLAAEIGLASLAVVHLADVSTGLAMVLVVTALAVTLAPGGTRSLTWSNVAQAIAALLALAVPVAIVAVLVTKLPLPQLSHGPLLRTLARNETLHHMPMVLQSWLGFELPGEGLSAIAKRYALPFGAVGQGAFSIASLTIMAGIATAPWLLPRVATAPGVYEARKSLGWATFFFGLAALTAAAIAVFLRTTVIELVSMPDPFLVPDWLKRLVELKFAGMPSGSGRPTLQGLTFDRDAMVMALPVVYGLPQTLFHVAISGVLAAALAGAGATATALGHTLSEDVLTGLTWGTQPNALRLRLARFGLVLAILLGASMAFLAPSDPLTLLLWAACITGSAIFPVLVLSIWWKRTNAAGALAGVSVGFLLSIAGIIADGTGFSPIEGALSGLVALPAGIAATIAASLATAAPGRHMLELVRDIRVPGGEIVYDREVRLARLKHRQRD